jgi:hypothetical protein
MSYLKKIDQQNTNSRFRTKNNLNSSRDVVFDILIK